MQQNFHHFQPPPIIEFREARDALVPETEGADVRCGEGNQMNEAQGYFGDFGRAFPAVKEQKLWGGGDFLIIFSR